MQDELGLTNIFNDLSPNATYVGVSRSGAVKLSMVTTDYFNSPNFNRKKVKRLQRTDISDLVASNLFLNLFTKPTYERTAFDNKPSDMVFGYGKNGAIYDRFELTLPEKCEILRKNHNIIVIKHPYFKLTITPAFTGFGEVIPKNFIEKYLKVENIKNISSFKVWIGINLKFSWKAFFIKKRNIMNG